MVIKKGSVRVETKLIDRDRRVTDPPGVVVQWLVWSVAHL
jgi:hypothetical protein